MKKKKTVAKQVNDPLKYVREFAPSLTVARASLLPFEDLITSESAGPQNGESDEPYFEVMVEASEYGPDARVAAHVTAEDVTITVYELIRDEDGEPEGEFEMDTWRASLEGLWEWLRQLPRPARSFRRRMR
jgi:hypothetical protein